MSEYVYLFTGHCLTVSTLSVQSVEEWYEDFQWLTLRGRKMGGGEG